MKVVLFCGGFGTRLREYSDTVPKPLVNVGNRPIIWHLMRYYSHFGFKEFILCLGYRGELIKDFFLKYDECQSNDFTLRAGGEEVELHASDIHDWTITFVDTGLSSNIAQRLTAVRPWLGEDEIFLANYSDGVSDLPLPSYVERFERSRALACFIGVRPTSTLSEVAIDDDSNVRSIEYISRTTWINGGFFVFRRQIFDYIREGEELVEEPFRRLIAEGKLMSHRYTGFWAAMDTFKDKKMLDDMWERGETPWRVWDGRGR